ncbi:MAG: hypothetical protein ACLUD2_02945 [Clostridium sp.]
MEKQRDLVQRAVKTRPASGRTERCSWQRGLRPCRGKSVQQRSYAKDKITINPEPYRVQATARRRSKDLGMFDERGNLTNLLLKGE